MFEKSITKKMQDVVLEGKIPAKTVCTQIKKPYSTLLRELNPFDTHAKLGVETMFDILKVTHNVTVLEFMAREMGYTLQPSPPKAAHRSANTPRRMEARL